MNIIEMTNKAINTARRRKDDRLLSGKYDHYFVVQLTSGPKVMRGDDVLPMHKIIWDTSREGKGTVNTDEVRV